eukprot:TRINITY_DN17651_c0_g1_i1.p1 TRINITY_DN17651_c0_g1~~TRINITY_DN17651_c0_g1_i1.p1  ORF type:complete len:379 (+),score=140.05 TRINITY_DN17651_c0_g1_i1:68-1138(+)
MPPAVIAAQLLLPGRLRLLLRARRVRQPAPRPRLLQRRWSSGVPSKNPRYISHMVGGAIVFPCCILGLWLLKGWVGGGDWAVSRFDVIALRDDLEELISANRDCAPLFVRLCWSAYAPLDFVELRRTGSCRYANNGTVGLPPQCDYAANKGLAEGHRLLAEIKAKHPNISMADLYVFAACIAISAMGGPRVPFKFGRKDGQQDDPVPPQELTTPPASSDVAELRSSLYRIGLNDKEIVALMGAHCVGHCHRRNSGFSGQWTMTPYRFCSQYFAELLTRDWELLPGSDSQFRDARDPKCELRMLAADVALIRDPMFRRWCEHFAEDEDDWHWEFQNAFGKLVSMGHPVRSLWGPLAY